VHTQLYASERLTTFVSFMMEKTQDSLKRHTLSYLHSKIT